MPIETVAKDKADALVEAGGRILEHRLEDGEPVCVVEVAENGGAKTKAAKGKQKDSAESGEKSQPEVEPESEE